MVTSWQASRSTKPIDLNHIRQSQQSQREIETPSWTWIIENYATELLQYSMWFIYLFSVFKNLNPKSSWWWLKLPNFRKFHVTIHECLQCRYIEMNTIPLFIGIIVDGRLQSQKKSCTSKDCRGLDVPMYCCRCLANVITHRIWSANPVFFVGILKAWKIKTLWYSENKEFAYHHRKPRLRSGALSHCLYAKRNLVWVCWCWKRYLSSHINMFHKFHAQHDKWIRITNPSTYIINSRSTIHNYHLLPKPSSRGFKGFTKTIPFNHGLRWRLRCPPPHVSQESDQLLLGLMGHDLNEEGGTYGGIFWCIP